VSRRLLCLFLLAAAQAGAQPVYEDTVEPYVVKSGDTISHITQRLLGDATFWQDNWKLNPQVRDPDRLRIGQVLQIITRRKVIAESARVVEAVNETQKMLGQPQWEPARPGDLLASGNGLRTRANSTAELRFNAESSLRLGEYSQVFLARKDTSLRGVDRGSVKVEKGAVDLVFAPMARPRTEIELIAGPASARPKAGTGTTLRAGASEDGSAKVMVYAGGSEVAAGGSTVKVAAGMGTAVPEQGPPAPPEPLLPAPRLDTPTQRWSYSNGLLRWQPAPGSVKQVVEVCADAACRSPLQRHELAGAAAQLQVAPLPAGRSHWRVYGISASGLDGYPSAVGEVEVLDPRPDLDGPMLAVLPLGNSVEGADGALRIGAQARFRVVAHDEASGMTSLLWRQHGQWQALPDRPLSIDELAAAGAIGAEDALGNRSERTLVFSEATP
jgi:LysM repeat protein